MKMFESRYLKVLFVILAFVMAVAVFTGCKKDVDDNSKDTSSEAISEESVVSEESLTNKELFFNTDELENLGGLLSKAESEATDKFPLDSVGNVDKLKGSVVFKLGDIKVSGMTLSMNISAAAQFISDIANGKSQVKLDVTALTGAATVTVYNDVNGGKTVLDFGELLEKAAVFEGSTEELIDYMSGLLDGSSETSEENASSEAEIDFSQIADMFENVDDDLAEIIEKACSEDILGYIFNMLKDGVADEYVTAEKEKVTVGGAEFELDAVKIAMDETASTTYVKTFLTNVRADEKIKAFVKELYDFLKENLDKIDSIAGESSSVDFPETFEAFWGKLDTAISELEIPETTDGSLLIVKRYFKDGKTVGFAFEYDDKTDANESGIINFFMMQNSEGIYDIYSTYKDSENKFVLTGKVSETKSEFELKITVKEQSEEESNIVTEKTTVYKITSETVGNETKLTLVITNDEAEITVNAKINIKENTKTKFSSELNVALDVKSLSTDAMSATQDMTASFSLAVEFEIPETVEIVIPETEDAYDLKDEAQLTAMSADLIPKLKEEFKDIITLFGMLA